MRYAGSELETLIKADGFRGTFGKGGGGGGGGVPNDILEDS